MKYIRRFSLFILTFHFCLLLTAFQVQGSNIYRMPWFSADSSNSGINTGNDSNIGKSIHGTPPNSSYKLTSGYEAYFRRDTRPLVLIIASLDNNLGTYWEQVINSAEKAVDGGQHVRILIDGPGDNNSFVYDLTSDSNNFCPSIQGDLLCGRYEEGINRWTWTEDSSHPVSLYRFMADAMDAYPHADSVTLSLIGHGSGWGTDILPGQPRRWSGQPRGWSEQAEVWPDRPDNLSPYDRSNGFLWDDFPGEQSSVASSVSDLRLILEGVIKHTDRKIDLLYFDACSMGMAEVAYELRDVTSYLLTAENTAWASFNYDALVGAVKPGMDGREIGTAWLALETDSLKNGFGYPFSMALYDQSKIYDLASAMQFLASSLNDVSVTQRALIIQAVEATERVESNYNGVIDTSDSYIDLLHFANQIGANFSGNSTMKGAVKSVQTAVNSVVVHKESRSGYLLTLPGQTRNFDNTGGISFYFPSHQDELKRVFFYNKNHLQWTSATGWDDFLDNWYRDTIQITQESGYPSMPVCNSTDVCEGLANPLSGPQKEFCDTGLGHESMSSLKSALSTQAKITLVNDLFSQQIKSTIEQRSCNVTRNDIILYLAESIQISKTEYYNGEDFAEVCISISAYVTENAETEFSQDAIVNQACN